MADETRVTLEQPSTTIAQTATLADSLRSLIQSQGKISAIKDLDKRQAALDLLTVDPDVREVFLKVSPLTKKGGKLTEMVRKAPSPTQRKVSRAREEKLGTFKTEQELAPLIAAANEQQLNLKAHKMAVGVNEAALEKLGLGKVITLENGIKVKREDISNPINRGAMEANYGDDPVMRQALDTVKKTVGAAQIKQALQAGDEDFLSNLILGGELETFRADTSDKVEANLMKQAITSLTGQEKINAGLNILDANNKEKLAKYLTSKKISLDSQQARLVKDFADSLTQEERIVVGKQIVDEKTAQDQIPFMEARMEAMEAQSNLDESRAKTMKLEFFNKLEEQKAQGKLNQKKFELEKKKFVMDGLNSKLKSIEGMIKYLKEESPMGKTLARLPETTMYTEEQKILYYKKLTELEQQQATIQQQLGAGLTTGKPIVTPPAPRSGGAKVNKAQGDQSDDAKFSDIFNQLQRLIGE